MLCFEITETAAISHLDAAGELIENLHALGVTLALDDVGSGAASFGYLKRLAVDYLKIDGMFVRGIESDPLDTAAIRCFQEIAGVLGVRTIAEWIENDHQLELLRNLGVHYGQGYLFAHPAPLDEVLGGPPS